MRLIRVIQIDKNAPDNESVLWIDTNDESHILAKVYSNGGWNTVEYIDALNYVNQNDLETALLDYITTERFNTEMNAVNAALDDKASLTYVNNAFVSKVAGKELSSNDFTDSYKTKLDNIDAGADSNVIEDIKVNGASLTVVDKSVDVTVPTRTSDLTNDSGFLDSSSDVVTQSELNSEISRATLAEDEINAKIPSEASSTNKLADKEYVGTSISAASPDFKGVFTAVSQLPTTNVGINDYAFITSVDSNGNTIYSRYKYNGTSWIFEYDENNLTLTDSQWDAVNSGITQSQVTQITTNKTDISNHVSRVDNPHQVTKTQIGLSNVDNTSDSSKPVSTLQQAAIDAKQDILTSSNAGTNITISNGVISSTAVSDYADITNKPSINSVTLSGNKTSEGLHIIYGSDSSSSELPAITYADRATGDADGNTITTTYATKTDIDNKQDTLVSGTTIKTINGSSLLGSGDITISSGGTISIDSAMSSTSENPVQNKVITAAVNAKQDTLVSGTTIKTVNDTSLLGSGNIVISGSGTTDYASLTSKPSINSVELSGNKTSADLSIASAQSVTDEISARTTADALKENLSNKVTTLSASSTDAQYPSAKIVYDNMALKASLTDLASVQTSVTDVQSSIDTHTSNTSNPHSVTKTQVGLSNVDNTSDINKPVSTAAQTAIDAKQDTLVSGTTIKTINSESLLGSGNIAISGGGTTDYTALTNKPSINSVELSGNKTLTDLGIASAQSVTDEASARTTADALKEDLSNKVTSLTASSTDTQYPSAKVTYDNLILKASSSDLTSHVFNVSNPHSVTKTQVGLSNVDNTSDVDKPISTAQAAVNALKANTADLAAVATSGSYTDLSDKPTIPASVTVDSALSSTSENPVQNKIINTALGTKQDTLISNTNIKTVNGSSLLGSGDLAVTASGLEVVTVTGITVTITPEWGHYYLINPNLENTLATLTINAPASTTDADKSKEIVIAFYNGSSTVAITTSGYMVKDRFDSAIQSLTSAVFRIRYLGVDTLSNIILSLAIDAPDPDSRYSESVDVDSSSVMESTVTLTPEWNKIYNLGLITSLTVNLPTTLAYDKLITIRYRTSSTTVVTWPTSDTYSIMWANGSVPPADDDAVIEVSIAYSYNTNNYYLLAWVQYKAV